MFPFNSGFLAVGNSVVLIDGIAARVVLPPTSDGLGDGEQAVKCSMCVLG